MKANKDWQCQECGRSMTARAVERAITGTRGCAGCGGVDIQPKEDWFPGTVGTHFAGLPIKAVKS